MTSNHYCSVPQCHSWAKKDLKKEFSFHRFPNEKSGKVYVETEVGRELVDRRKLWITKLRIGKPVTKFMKVCSKHFKPDDYFYKGQNTGNRGPVLKKTAVPSRNLPTVSLQKSELNLSHWSERYQQRQLTEAPIKTHPDCPCQNKLNENHSKKKCGKRRKYSRPQKHTRASKARRRLGAQKRNERLAGLLALVQLDHPYGSRAAAPAGENFEDESGQEVPVQPQCFFSENQNVLKYTSQNISLEETAGQNIDLLLKQEAPDLEECSLIPKEEYDSFMAHELRMEPVPPPEESEPLKGHRLVNLKYVLNWSMSLQQEHAKVCPTGKLAVAKETRHGFGLVSRITFQCDRCGYEVEKLTEDPEYLYKI